MEESSEILYVDDDLDDQYLLRMALNEIGSKYSLKCFPQGQKLIDYLTSARDKPFMIICDLRIADMSGLELRRRINDLEVLRIKSIPFIFFSQIIREKDVEDAYLELVQGFFKKPGDYDAYKIMLKSIIFYWSNAIHPLRNNNTLL
jgi:CheY-like chemotaxis protein